MLQLLRQMSLVLAFPTLVLAESAEGPVDFMRDIRPILSQNCFACHGPDEETREAGLRLDRRDDFIDSGMSAVISGNVEESELFARLATDDEYLRMPPPETGKALSDEQIELMRRWIEQGAPYAEHWSFQPLVAQPLPHVQQAEWTRNEIDAFVLASLEEASIAPSPEADRTTLIRRLSMDLTGLPPTPHDIKRFIEDERPGAYEALVDRLLQSPHVGERWGRHWLDLARYADSDGYLGDDLRPNAWVYRDWVIDAINRDQPFDQFTIEQLAGDLLPDAALEQKIATGFHRNTMKNTEAGADRELDRVIRTVDRTSTTGTVWLGLTLGCAECHTHKFDPISHTEFYQMYAFFNNAEERDLPAALPEQQAEYEKARAAWQKKVNAVKKAIQQTVEGLNREQEDDPFDQDTIQAILRKDPSKRQQADEEKLEELWSHLDQHQRDLFDQYEKLAATMPAPPKRKAPTISEAAKERPTHVHLRGDFRSPGEQVQPGTLNVLHPLETRGEVADRLDLAHWIVDPANPLTPRTAVNHVWKHLFGRGLVYTTEDFGTTGETPSHPALLDWLAITFRDSGWSRKQLIRKIVTSATYRQASDVRPELLDIDPQNVLLARQSRFRFEAEVIRDAALTASGLLAPKIGGPSVRPMMNTQITEISRNKDWKVSAGSDKYRRGMYTLFRRGTPYPMLTTFDAPDSTITCARRERSNSPLQSLTLLNDPVFSECAQHLGRRLIDEVGTSPDEWIPHSFRLCLGRPPQAEEVERVRGFLVEQREMIANLDESERVEMVGEPLPNVDLERQAECVALARLLINLDEFITRE